MKSALLKVFGFPGTTKSQVKAQAKPKSIRVLERVLDLGDRSVPMTVRLDKRARRISVKVDPTKAQVILTAPPRAGIEEAVRFAGSQIRWIEQRLARVPDAQPFIPGAVIPVEGRELTLTHCPDRRGVVWIEGDQLCVAGAAAHMARRVEDWLKAQARARLAAASAHYAGLLGLKAPKIQIRDSVTRWGSCSSTGVISYSWRLILAPPSVLTYVAAHEVCHLRHMDHSDLFWALCNRLIDDTDTPRHWLKAFGARLHRFGQAH